ncbi:UTP--glucose-1-phosphate uridylyltransferase GalU [Sphingomonas sp. DT-204]|uniref:UTP--glucose-1-phosphate uridylyltransferase GalU n=1 Tax=Sphingomonas sp. DT-204 TaxID=3396166 RepID=UPI003F19F636
MSARPVRKAVFPVGGLGTRFLPATKAIPKEMLPIVDRPLIQYAVEEALEAGIEQMVFVTGRGKAAIEDHFDIAFELEATMSGRGKSLDILGPTRLRPGAVTYVRQQEPLGLGHAVWCARDVVGDEPFAVLLADDFMVGKPGCLKQMIDAYNRVGGNVICAEVVPDEHTHRYGIITPGAADGPLTEVKGLVEKPAPGTAPSNLSVIGRYILQPEVMTILSGQEKGAGGEIQLTDAMARMIGEQAFHGLTFAGTRYDCGDKIGFLHANLAMALSREEMADDVELIMNELLEARVEPRRAA